MLLKTPALGPQDDLPGLGCLRKAAGMLVVYTSVVFLSLCCANLGCLGDGSVAPQGVPAPLVGIYLVMIIVDQQELDAIAPGAVVGVQRIRVQEEVFLTVLLPVRSWSPHTNLTK